MAGPFRKRSLRRRIYRIYLVLMVLLMLVLAALMFRGGFLDTIREIFRGYTDPNSVLLFIGGWLG